ncbi:MAG: acyl-CoA thioesterase [Planctomycetales bacterium]|nr:acyl-CoA thioesterase [Planctomycetales bacterium]NIM09380.1 acyl-CoA thioesterase [Planctomycetales bacterium]NIN08850.1 acyl-CoA thioesterase [Planctomycetales bacterium]NIN77967.1 acyl-CoA thioesterase [Planctomycetales bacterium]NIO35150.1 acyl-CoA thioesterase [Planctomycetales bacterium]
MSNTHEIPQLFEYPAVITLPVQWGDQDAFGHVNNTVPIRWFESSRIHYLQQTGWPTLKIEENLGPILVAIHCNYRLQLEFPDTVHIGARVARVGNSSVTVQHLVYSQKHQDTAAEGKSVIVFFDYGRQKPVRVPEDIRSAIERMEGKT